MVEIQNSPEYDILLKSFSTQINGDHTISATANNNEVNMKTFSLLLASMRTQLRTSTTAYVGALTGVYGNLNRSENVETGFQPREAKSIKNGFTTEEITTICVKFNRAVERVVDKFRDKTLEVAQTTRTSDSEQLDRDIAEQHKLNNQEGRYRVAEEVIDQVGKRGERAARAADAGKKEEFLTAIDEFFKNNILKKVNKHNENITDWNIARDELTAFLATSKADEFFAEKPGKDFNGIELANGLQEYLAEKFPEMKEAEMGALFTKCYSLIHGKDLTAEQLLTHNPTEHSEAVKKIVKAAAEAEAANAQAGPTA
ncbi:MAG: hypothetical protein J6J33_04265 [Clostridia bacterium]|nr:hypothetical protein [Clostridia bacterium]